jgi:hypothetical protein
VFHLLKNVPQIKCPSKHLNVLISKIISFQQQRPTALRCKSDFIHPKYFEFFGKKKGVKIVGAGDNNIFKFVFLKVLKSNIFPGRN